MFWYSMQPTDIKCSDFPYCIQERYSISIVIYILLCIFGTLSSSYRRTYANAAGIKFTI